MEEVNIKSVPNQVVDYIFNSTDFYSIHIYTLNGLTYTDISRNGNQLTNGVLAFDGVNLIPSAVLTNGGNFRFSCVNKDSPYYKNFGLSQRLIFYTNDELNVGAQS